MGVADFRPLEIAALATIFAGFLPALSSRPFWIALLSILSGLVIWQGTETCLNASEGLEGLTCSFGMIIGATLAVASVAVAIVRVRYRTRGGAETWLGRPWIAALAIYALAVIGFVLFVYLLSIS